MDELHEGYITPASEMRDWSDAENKGFQTHFKVMHIFFCAFGPDEYGRVFSCSNAKEIWDKLEVTHEGTKEVEETKIGLLNLEYENFKMNSTKVIKAMSNRFSTIVNGLKDYGEVIILEGKLVQKLIYLLSESWEFKMTTIIEANNVKTLKFDELIGSLLTHKIMSKTREKEKKENVAFKTPSSFQEKISSER